MLNIITSTRPRHVAALATTPTADPPTAAEKRLAEAWALERSGGCPSAQSLATLAFNLLETKLQTARLLLLTADSGIQCRAC